MPGMRCNNCGESDFHLDSGHYYCNECQFQLQDIQEHCYNDGAFGNREPVTTSLRKLSKHKDTTETATPQKRLTSWERYNFIIVGLTKELLGLGAKPQLATVMEILWFRYLEKLQVLGPTIKVPKLQAVNSKRDAEIIYGTAKKRKKRKRSSVRSRSGSEYSDSTSLSSKSDRNRQKRLLMQSHFENSQTEGSSAPSLLNESLESLRSTSDINRSRRKIKYNYTARTVLRKSTNNGRRIKATSYREIHRIAPTYINQPDVLSPNKIYILLYLGLIIVQDDIQLGDLFRFIDEGHLSFNSYHHFFPDTILETCKDVLTYSTKYQQFSNKAFRRYTAKMAHLLQISAYIVKPDLVKLCQRYCDELNLPQEFSNCCIALIRCAKIRLNFHQKSAQIPNYEGRILGCIVYVLKLLYGLDNRTEYELGDYTKILSQCRSLPLELFDVNDWLKHLNARHQLITKYHFPTNFLDNNFTITDPDLFLRFIRNRNLPVRKIRKKHDTFYYALQQLQNKVLVEDDIDFKPTLTPFKQYLSQILRQTQLQHTKNLQLLECDFSKKSIIHLLEPEQFLNVIGTEHSIEIIHGGANLRFIFPENYINDDLEFHLSQYDTENEKFFQRNSKYSNQECNSSENDIDFTKLQKDIRKNGVQTYFHHYNPFERYYVLGRLHNTVSCEQYFKSRFPKNLQIILQECFRICRQESGDFLNEFLQTELYLLCLADYNLPQKIPKHRIGSERELKKYLARFSKCW